VSKRERVLVVDEVTDTAEVLQAVLEPKGLTVNRVSRIEQTPPTVEGLPAVVVVDAETYDGATQPGWQKWRNVPQVIIGTMRLPQLEENGSPERRRYLQKPFQFADLVNAIESLIAEQAHDLNG
jgi:DNA-binding response OmpR family regulator